MSEPFVETFARAVNPGTLGVFVTLLVLSVAIAALICILLVAGKVAGKDVLARTFVLLLGLAIFGSIAGYAGGISREAAVGQIIPAVLGLAGGLAVYLFGIDTSRGAIASVALTAFTVALFFGYSFGSDVRASNDINAEIRAACLGLFYDPSTYEDKDTYDLAIGDDATRLKDCTNYWNAPR